MPPFEETARWIWAEPDEEFGGRARAASVALFRRTFECASTPAELVCHVSADSRYILWCNGTLVARGPGKGDIRHQFYDTVDVSRHLWPGKNVLAALVIGYAQHWPDYNAGGPSVLQMTATNGFILDAQLRGADSKTLPLHTDSRWKARHSPCHALLRNSGVPCAGPGELRLLDDFEATWRCAEFDDSAWPETHVFAAGVRPDNVVDTPWPHRLIPRTVPFLREEARRFTDVCDAKGVGLEHVAAMLKGSGLLSIPANQEAEFMLVADALETAYPKLQSRGGEGAKVQLFYSERLAHGGQIVRDHRQPHEPVTGPQNDRVSIDRSVAEWQPLLWRTFRFVRVTIKTAGEPLQLRLAEFTHTAYPYLQRGNFESDDPVHAELWKAGLRTLELCSHETFEDCPYYEQLQYAGDVQVSADTAYYATGDTALARQAILHFAWSVNEEGLTASRYPSRVPQLIPLWSLHWIAASHDYWWYTGETELVRQIAPQLQGVLAWFLKHRTASGVIGKLPYWCVADWSLDWPKGIPPGMKEGPSGMPNFMLLACLKQTAELLDAINEKDAAARWRSEASTLARAANAHFWNPALGLYLDRADQPKLASQLTNAWAILSGLGDAAQTASVGDKLCAQPGLCRAAFFGKYFVFHALLQGERRADAYALLDEWRELLARGCTTFPEDPGFGRSECHGWSGLPNVALQRLLLGVGVTRPGCRAVCIQPYWAGAEKAAGTVALPQGDLHVNWRKDGGKTRIEVTLPSGVEGTAQLPDGKSVPLRSGKQALQS